MNRKTFKCSTCKKFSFGLTQLPFGKLLCDACIQYKCEHEFKCDEPTVTLDEFFEQNGLKSYLYGFNLLQETSVNDDNQRNVNVKKQNRLKQLHDNQIENQPKAKRSKLSEQHKPFSDFSINSILYGNRY